MFWWILLFCGFVILSECGLVGGFVRFNFLFVLL